MERLEIKLSQIPMAGKYLSDIPGFGFLDDAAVTSIAYKLVHHDVMEYKAWRDAIKHSLQT